MRISDWSSDVCSSDLLDNNSYTSATAKLKALESRYPFGRYADQAQLELIYANYKNAEPEAAKSAAERFIRLHPQHPNVDYAYRSEERSVGQECVSTCRARVSP